MTMKKYSLGLAVGGTVTHIPDSDTYTIIISMIDDRLVSNCVSICLLQCRRPLVPLPLRLSLCLYLDS